MLGNAEKLRGRLPPGARLRHRRQREGRSTTSCRVTRDRRAIWSTAIERQGPRLLAGPERLRSPLHILHHPLWPRPNSRSRAARRDDRADRATGRRAAIDEIVLTGVDLTSYGADLPERAQLGRAGAPASSAQFPSFAACGCPRSTRSRSTRQLVAAIAERAAADAAPASVAASRRRHDPEAHEAPPSPRRGHRFLPAIRAVRPDIVFGADLIAGFPTETEAMFRIRCDLVDGMRPRLYLHVFPVQPAPRHPGGAHAAARSGQVVSERAARLRDAAAAALAADLGAAGRPRRGGAGRGARSRPRRMLHPTALAGSAGAIRRGRDHRPGWPLRLIAEPLRRRLTHWRSASSSGIVRFWRRNVPNEAPAEDEPLPPINRAALDAAEGRTGIRRSARTRRRRPLRWRRALPDEPPARGCSTDETPAEPPPASSRPPPAAAPGLSRRITVVSRAAARTTALRYRARTGRRPAGLVRSGCAPACRAARHGSTSNIAVFARRRLDAAALEELEELLIPADLGMETASPRGRRRAARLAASTRMSPRGGARGASPRKS